MWWTRGAQLPALVTTSPAGTARADSGVLGRPNTSVVFGDERVNDLMRSGLRLNAGVWFDCAKTTGLEFDFFALETANTSITRASAGDPAYARPFIDAGTRQQSSELVSYPGVVNGGIAVESTSPGLWGWGIARRARLGCCYDSSGDFGTRTDWLIGYRHLRLDDRLSIYERLSSPLFVAGSSLSVDDRFSTRNSFHGLELGLVRTEQHARWELDYFGKVAVGWNDARVRIRGETTVAGPGFAPVVRDGGFYALSSNSGRYDDGDFASVFQFGTNLAYRLSDRLQMKLGYTLLIWPDVFRAADQIDTTINPNLLPPPIVPLVGPVRPSATLRDTDFWAQGLNLGIEYRF